MRQSILDVRNLRKSHAAHVRLDDISFSVSEGEKVGIIGRNGSGKTTLLRIVAGVEGHEDGVVARRKHIGVGYLAQDPDVEATDTVIDAVARRQISQDAPTFERDSDHRIERILTRLGVTGWDRVMEELSGGERKRVALARTLLSDPGLLLLDEPTNHLDAETVLWLEEVLFDFPGAALVVTHDRYFLDRVVDRMIEISRGVLNFYDGGYTEYLEARAERSAREQVESVKRARFLHKELTWARRSPPARTGKQKARRQRALQLETELQEQERSTYGDLELDMGSAPRLGSRVIELHDLTFGYGGEPVIKGFSDRLLAGERIGVIGPNGSGKTTLLRLLIGEEAPDTGRIQLGENTRIGYFDQERAIDLDLTVERVVSKGDWVQVDGRSVHVRAYLDRFLFPPHVQRQKVGSLSGGERNRLLLAKLLLQEFNLLVLDEPTNDLDLDTLRILEDELERFPGCVVVVTHDRYLLDKLATSLWIFEEAGRVHRHHGGWDAYLSRREGVREREVARVRDADRDRRNARAEAARLEAKEARNEQKRLSYNERRELDGMEACIAGLERERDELSKLLGDPAFYQEGETRVPDVTIRYRELELEIEMLYKRWMELEERA